MIQKDLAPILIAIAMVLIILNFDFEADYSAKRFWTFMISLVVLAAAIIMIYNNRGFGNKN